jgi:DNA-binding response OmpR family regulator
MAVAEADKAHKKIVIVENNMQDRVVISDLLRHEFDFSFVDSCQELERFLSTKDASLLIINPDLNEDIFFKSFEQYAPSKLPLIITTSINDLNLLRRFYKSGAASCLVKPYHASMLMIAIEQALLDRSGDSATEINLESFEICSKNSRINSKQLTAKEMQIFSMLHKNPGASFTREQLIKQIWGKVSVSAKALDVHLFNLRSKLAPLNIKINYEPKKGFCLIREEAAVGFAPDAIFLPIDLTEVN